MAGTNRKPYKVATTNPYRWAWEQVHGKSVEEKMQPRIKCNICVQNGKLRQTGWSHPKSWFCPVCGSVYGNNGDVNKEYTYSLKRGLIKT